MGWRMHVIRLLVQLFLFPHCCDVLFTHSFSLHKLQKRLLDTYSCSFKFLTLAGMIIFLTNITPNEIKTMTQFHLKNNVMIGY